MNTFFHTLFLFFTLYYCISFAHDCDHDNIEQDIRFLDIEEDMSTLDQGRALTAANYPSIRIYAYYDFLKKTASTSFAAYIENQLIPPIVDYFQSALKVKFPVSGNLKLSLDVGSICEQATPMALRGAGVPADFFIYYDSEAFIDSAQIANTKYCYLSSGTKRPLIARTIINRNTLSMANGDVLLHEKNIYVLMHEMVHGLGFSSSTFKLFIDANGKPLRGHIKSAKMNGITRIFLDVAPLTQKLRNHFGCPSLEGALLENNGGAETAGSHFERKMFLYEAMTSGSMIGRRISELSLALLEGSGWYIPDYDYAEPFFFGKGQGCSFVTCSNCTNFEEFCSGSDSGCSAHGRGAGSCSSDSTSDGCKYYSPTTDYDCENENGGAFSRLPELQAYGAGSSSKCFAGTLNSLNSVSSNSLTTFCFKYICSGSGTDTKLQVLVGNQIVNCVEEGTVTVDGYYGSVNCPDPLAFCNTVGLKYCPRNCMGRGTCVDGVCQCRSGYSGVDCALTNCW